MTKPWLSVIVPVHQGERFLGATLASAAAERPEGVEFLLYDSGDDVGGCQRIAEGFADRMDILWQATPDMLSWTAKTNYGVSNARADHVCILHQDDLWLPGHIAAVRMGIAADPDATLSIASARFASMTDQLVGRWRLPFRPGKVGRADFVETVIVQNSIAICSPVMRRDAWLACGGMDDALWYTADWDLYLKLAQAGDVVVRAEETTAFRLHGGSLTMTGSRDAKAFREQFETVLARHIGTIPIMRRKKLARRARASIAVNCALAAASGGKGARLAGAALELLRIGPAEVALYINQSRIFDRTLPRMRLMLTRGM